MKVQFTNFVVDDVLDLHMIQEDHNQQSPWMLGWTKFVVFRHEDTWQSETNMNLVSNWIEKNLETDGAWGVYSYSSVERGDAGLLTNRADYIRQNVCHVVVGFEDNDDALRFKLMAGSNPSDFADGETGVF